MKLSIGEKIALLRKEKGVTQTELAEYLYLAPQTVSRWEVGNGAPEISLLPRIAAFFGVTIDTLFGQTPLEHIGDLVCKYSVLRDDRSFSDAMEAINSQMQSVTAFLNGGTENADKLRQDLDRLEAEKIHMLIQQGREAFHQALEIVESFVERTEDCPEHPWYLRMRLQRGQLYENTGRGRDALEEYKKRWKEKPDEITLLMYISMLDNRQDYESILSLVEKNGPAGEILYLYCNSEINLSIWSVIIHAAAKVQRTDVIGRHITAILEMCTKEEKIDLLMCILDVYQGEQKESIKEEIRSLLPDTSINRFFKEKIKDIIGDFC